MVTEYAYGRSAGYSVAGTRMTTLGYEAATGRLATMDAGGQFAWEYLAGTDLKSALDYPNGARTEYTYESGRDLLTNVRNAKGETVYSNAPYSVCKEFIWDPTEPVATTPLCFREYGQADAYLMHDGNKNVTDVIAASAATTQLAHVAKADGIVGDMSWPSAHRQDKVLKLAIPHGVSVRTALVYEGKLSPQVETEGCFDLLLPFASLFEP